MPSYIIAQVKVHDSQEYENYRSSFMDALTPFDGRILVSTVEAEILEGQWPEVKTVILEFPSRDVAMAWYNSDQYQKIAQHRFRAAKTNMVLIDGFVRR